MNQDLIIEILSHLPLKDKVNSALICKEWYQLNKYIYTKQPINLEYKHFNTENFIKWSNGKIFDINLYIHDIDTEYGLEFKILDKFFHRIRLLNLFRNKIYNFPVYIPSLIHLQHLRITNNYLEIIPDSIQQLTLLKILDLSDNNIKFFPESVTKLPNLEILLIDYNIIEHVPECINNMKKLTKLDLSNNCIITISDTIQLDKLIHLSLSSNKIENISITKCFNLKYLSLKDNFLQDLTCYAPLIELDLRTNKLTSIPNCLYNLYTLEKLYLSYNYFTELTIPELKNLKFLDLKNAFYPVIKFDLLALNLTCLNLSHSYGVLTTIPESIKQLKNLTELYLSHNKLHFLPEFITEFKQLKILNLYSNYISQLPSSIGNLTNLEYIDLNFNDLIKLPKSISKLHNLKKLYVGHNQLNNLPDELCLLKNIIDIRLMHNKLKKLPNEIGKLVNLKILCLTSNKLKSLPESIGNLKKLELFECEFNSLKTIPDTICNLSNLEQFLLDGNELTKLPENIGYIPNLSLLSIYNNRLKKLPPSTSRIFSNKKDILLLQKKFNISHLITNRL